MKCRGCGSNLGWRYVWKTRKGEPRDKQVMARVYYCPVCDGDQSIPNIFDVLVKKETQKT